MAISKKRIPSVSDSVTQRAIQQIYDDINELVNAVNQGNTSKYRTSNTGKSGDMRIGRNNTGNYFLELCTDEGWVVSTNTTATGFKFQDKSEEDLRTSSQGHQQEI